MNEPKKCCEKPRMQIGGWRLAPVGRQDGEIWRCARCGTEDPELQYKPELGQFVFGNPTGRFDFDAMPDSYVVEEMLRLIAYRAAGNDSDAGDFENAVFVMRPYYWGDDEAEAAKPNFLHKASGLEIRWYKYIGRGMTVNRHVCPDCFQDIFAECMNSLLPEEARHAKP